MIFFIDYNLIIIKVSLTEPNLTHKNIMAKKIRPNNKIVVNVDLQNKIMLIFNLI